jgi:hypothetical protein
MEKVFIEGSLVTKFIFYRRQSHAAHRKDCEILRRFPICDKLGWTHTSDAVAAIKVALQPWQVPGTRTLSVIGKCWTGIDAYSTI